MPNRLPPAFPRFAFIAMLAAAVVSPPPAARAQPGDDLIVEAREALRKRDRPRLTALRNAAVAARHPLAMWPDYWELGSRLAEAQQADLDAFYARWGGTYVEDRLRNDWLLELGRRRDWANFAREHPRYRMNDDREVACYALLLRHQGGEDVRAAARAAWAAQRDADDGCQLLGATLYAARQFDKAEVWRIVRLGAEFNRPRAARAAAALIHPTVAARVADAWEQPVRFLVRHKSAPHGTDQDLALIALMRLAATEPEVAAGELDARWQRQLGDERAAHAWAMAGKQAALKLLPQAADYYRRAWQLQRGSGHPASWSDDTLAWSARAALRTPRLDRVRATLIVDSIEAMSAAEQKDPAWVYWKARAMLARAGKSAEGEAEAARALLQGLSSALNFYGKLAADELGTRFALPAAAAPPTEAEAGAAAATPGLDRGLKLASLGLRDEGRREWNYTLRGMTDRELLAAAQLACNAADWQLCINTSERTRAEVDLAQRYPTPFRDEIVARAAERGLDPALVFGLIRQETRFMPALRSSAGAQGLMQLMPATARWTARKIGLDLKPEQITDVDVNLRLGTTYLKAVLDDFAGSQPMAAAAYNAGPGRPRRWRDGPVLEPAAWAENIPFNETRDYVKKVLSNAVVYSALLGATEGPTLRQRLGPAIGPRDAGAPAADRDLP